MRGAAAPNPMAAAMGNMMNMMGMNQFGGAMGFGRGGAMMPQTPRGGMMGGGFGGGRGGMMGGNMGQYYYYFDFPIYFVRCLCH